MAIDWSEWEKYLPPLLMGVIYILSQILFKKKPHKSSRTNREKDILNQANPTSQETQTENDIYYYPDEASETFFEQVYEAPEPIEVATPENQPLNKLELFQKALNVEATPSPSNHSNKNQTPKKNQSNPYTTHLKKLSNSKSFKKAFILKELVDPPKSIR